MYLIEPPTVEWKNLILSQGEVVLGGVRFIVEMYDFRKFNGGSDLWKEEEFKRIASNHGGFLIDVHPRSWDHVDLTILRIHIGVKSKDVVLSCRHMLFIDDLDNHRYHTLQFNVEDEYAFTHTKQYWQMSKLLVTTTVNVSPRSISLRVSKSVPSHTNTIFVLLPTSNIIVSTTTDPIPVPILSDPPPMIHQAPTTSAPLTSIPVASMSISIIPLCSSEPQTLSLLPQPASKAIQFLVADKYPSQNLMSDDWDPWEAASANFSQAMVLYEPNQPKRKTPPEIRYSVRLQNKLSTGVKSKVSFASGSSSQGIDTTNLLDQFSFGKFSDSEVVSFFEKNGFSLENKENTRLQVVTKF
jgi:hypothetical protein